MNYVYGQEDESDVIYARYKESAERIEGPSMTSSAGGDDDRSWSGMPVVAVISS